MLAECAQEVSQQVVLSAEKLEKFAAAFWGSLDQETFNHDKGQKSAISARRLHWIFLNFLQWIF